VTPSRVSWASVASDAVAGRSRKLDLLPAHPEYVRYGSTVVYAWSFRTDYLRLLRGRAKNPKTSRRIIAGGIIARVIVADFSQFANKNRFYQRDVAHRRRHSSRRCLVLCADKNVRPVRSNIEYFGRISNRQSFATRNG